MSLPPGARRAGVLHALAETGQYDMATRIALCEQALEEARDDDSRSSQLLSFMAMFLWSAGDVATALARARAGLVLAERHGDPEVLASAIATVGMMETWFLDITPGLLEHGAAIEESLPRPLMVLNSPRFFLAQRWVLRDELAEAEAIGRHIEAAAAESGDEYTRHYALAQSSVGLAFAGRLHEAMRLVTRAHHFAMQTGEPQFAVVTAQFLSLVQTDLGLLDAATQTATEGLRLAESISSESQAIANTHVLGRIELLRGDPRAAAELLRDLPARRIPRRSSRSGLQPVGRCDRKPDRDRRSRCRTLPDDAVRVAREPLEQM